MLVGSSLSVISRGWAWFLDGKVLGPAANRVPETGVWVMLRATKSGRASVKKCVCVPVPGAEGEQKEAGSGRGSPPPSLVWPGWACCCSPVPGGH